MEPTFPDLADVASYLLPGDGFTSFVRASTPILLRQAYLLTGSVVAAEDLVQDTFVRLYPRWRKVADADVPLAYVRRSLANNFLSQRRKGTGREIVTDVVPDRPGERRAEHDVVDRAELSALLRTLTATQRTVLVMRFYAGLSDVEIAGQLGCCAGTVRSLASRGLATLRERVARESRRLAHAGHVG